MRNHKLWTVLALTIFIQVGCPSADDINISAIGFENIGLSWNPIFGNNDVSAKPFMHLVPLLSNRFPLATEVQINGSHKANEYTGETILGESCSLVYRDRTALGIDGKAVFQLLGIRDVATGLIGFTIDYGGSDTYKGYIVVHCADERYFDGVKIGDVNRRVMKCIAFIGPGPLTKRQTDDLSGYLLRFGGEKVGTTNLDAPIQPTPPSPK